MLLKVQRDQSILYRPPLPNGVTDLCHLAPLSSTRTLTSSSPALWVGTSRNSASVSTSGSHRTSCRCHFGSTWPGRSSDHTSSRLSSIFLGHLSDSPITSSSRLLRTLGGASVRRCAMLSIFAYSMFDLGRAGTCRTESVTEAIYCVNRAVIAHTCHVPTTHAVSDHQTRPP